MSDLASQIGAPQAHVTLYRYRTSSLNDLASQSTPRYLVSVKNVLQIDEYGGTVNGVKGPLLPHLQMKPRVVVWSRPGRKEIGRKKALEREDW